MEKYIYKITNNINKKVYIGQTNDIDRRFKEHKRCGSYEENEKLLYRAINKYGIDNFSFDIIEGPIKNYNEREIYWINYYNSFVANKNSWGYNMTPGGEEPPHPKGEEHHYATHTLEDIEKIISLLKNTKLSFLEISKTFNYSRSAIERINQGIIWNNEDLTYPIRSENTINFKIERANNIKYDLLNTNLTQKEIGKKYNVGRTTITAINRGQNFYDKELDYPLRKDNQQSKPIYMIDIESKKILKEFKDSVEAAQYLNNKLYAANIRACANKKINTAYGYIWKFKEK